MFKRINKIGVFRVDVWFRALIEVVAVDYLCSKELTIFCGFRVDVWFRVSNRAIDYWLSKKRLDLVRRFDLLLEDL